MYATHDTCMRHMYAIRYRSCRTMWKSDVVAQQQRALVLKSSEMLKYIAEAPAMKMG